MKKELKLSYKSIITMKNIRKIKMLASLLLLMGAMSACGEKTTRQVPEAEVMQGTFYIDIYEEGEIEALNSDRKSVV